MAIRLTLALHVRVHVHVHRLEDPSLFAYTDTIELQCVYV